MADNFLRQVYVAISSLPEWKMSGGDAGASTVKLFGDGSFDQLRIKFTLHKQQPDAAIPSSIQIYNLSKELRGELSKVSGAKVKVSAGWANAPVVEVFTGSMLYATHQREGADIITSLFVLSGWGSAHQAACIKTSAQDATVKDLVLEILNDPGLPGITVDPKNIVIADQSFGNQGWTFAGSVRDALNKLSSIYGFSWWIDQNVFYASDDTAGALPGGEVVISSKEGNLLRAEPMLSLAPDRNQQYGITITSLFEPRLKAGFSVKLESELNPQLNRSYTILNLTHVGDTHSDAWISQVEALMYGVV
jgi:hypothetical protein